MSLSNLFGQSSVEIPVEILGLVSGLLRSSFPDAPIAAGLSRHLGVSGHKQKGNRLTVN